MPLFMHMKKQAGYVMLRAWIDENDIRLEIEDQGKGIENIEQAMQPFYTSHPEQERTGMGFALMQSFMGSRARSVFSWKWNNRFYAETSA